MSVACLPCIQQSHRAVGATGLYGLRGLGVAEPDFAQWDRDCKTRGGTPVAVDPSVSAIIGVGPGVTGAFRSCRVGAQNYLMNSPELLALPPSKHDVMRDVVSAGVAFAATALYVKKAPKKWKRPGKVGAVAAVVGLYFLTSFAYGKLYT